MEVGMEWGNREWLGFRVAVLLNWLYMCTHDGLCELGHFSLPSCDFDGPSSCFTRLPPCNRVMSWCPSCRAAAQAWYEASCRASLTQNYFRPCPQSPAHLDITSLIAVSNGPAEAKTWASSRWPNHRPSWLRHGLHKMEISNPACNENFSALLHKISGTSYTNVEAFLLKKWLFLEKRTNPTITLSNIQHLD